MFEGSGWMFRLVVKDVGMPLVLGWRWRLVCTSGRFVVIIDEGGRLHWAKKNTKVLHHSHAIIGNQLYVKGLVASVIVCTAGTCTK